MRAKRIPTCQLIVREVSRERVRAGMYFHEISSRSQQVGGGGGGGEIDRKKERDLKLHLAA